MPQQATAQGHFTDTVGHISHDSVNYLMDHGILGDANSTWCGPSEFCPDRPVQRWMAVVWFVRALGNGQEPPPVTSTSFSDVAPTDYWAPHVEFLAALGMLKGYPDGTFRPFEHTVRQHMETILLRGLDKVPPNEATNIRHGALASLLCGHKGGSWCWYEKITRGESAIMLAAGLQGKLAQSPIQSPPGQFWDIPQGISAGAYHTCALYHGGEKDDRLACWGFNHFGQLDNPNPEHWKYKYVAAGGGHTCVIRLDDKIDCWGLNNHGQTDVPDGRYKAVAAGGLSTCAIRTNHKMACWGKNHKDRFTDSELLNPPTHSFDNLDVGSRHACAIGRGRSGQYNRKRLSCWGADDHFEVKRLPDHDSSIQYYGIATGDRLTCGFYTVAWGYQQLRCEGPQRGLAVHTNEPFEQGGTLYRENNIGAGWWHACVLRADRTPWCWGAAGAGNYGVGVDGTPTDEIFNSIAVGGTHNCAVRPDRTIRCWGFDNFPL